MTIPAIQFGYSQAQQHKGRSIPIAFAPSVSQPVEVLVKGRSAKDDAKIARNQRRFQRQVRDAVKQGIPLRNQVAALCRILRPRQIQFQQAQSISPTV